MKIKMMKLTLKMTIPALLAFTSCSSTPKAEADANLKADYSPILSETGRGKIVMDAEKSVFTVVAIDPGSRTVTLRESDGTLVTCECGPEVRNFDQIRTGDQVIATVALSVAVDLVKGDEVPLGAQTTTAVVRSPLGVGAKPGGKIVDTMSFTARVVNVDIPNRQVTLQKPDGESETVKVNPDIDLAKISTGDHVGVRVTRAFALTVTTPEKK